MTSITLLRASLPLLLFARSLARSLALQRRRSRDIAATGAAAALGHTDTSRLLLQRRTHKMLREGERRADESRAGIPPQHRDSIVRARVLLFFVLPFFFSERAFYRFFASACV